MRFYIIFFQIYSFSNLFNKCENHGGISSSLNIFFSKIFFRNISLSLVNEKYNLPLLFERKAYLKNLTNSHLIEEPSAIFKVIGLQLF